MRQNLQAALFLTLALAGCARATPEQQFISDAAAAMGGRDRVDAVRTLTIEGEGVNFNLGQDMRPEAATQTFAITGYKREIDVANSRQRVQQTRTPRFAYFQGPQPQTQITHAGNPHSDTMLMAYVQARSTVASAKVDRVVIQVDAFGPGSQSHPYAANLLENIQSRKLAVDRIVPLHSVIAPFAELVKAAGH